MMQNNDIRYKLRYVVERLRDGWGYGDPRNDIEKIHPLLKDWNKLSDMEKDITVTWCEEYQNT